MAYDPSKDNILHTWENHDTGLMISICRYGDGEEKLQIGPRKYTKKDGTITTTKPGRLDIDDALWLSENIEDIVTKMNEYYLKDS
ncbi:MAG: hypothetical protein JXA35_07050 [Deltaproteobacteria bacterium]|nr:hypothetical protein [Deltaproteobacteria bacterium]